MPFGCIFYHSLKHLCAGAGRLAQAVGRGEGGVDKEHLTPRRGGRKKSIKKKRFSSVPFATLRVWRENALPGGYRAEPLLRDMKRYQACVVPQCGQKAKSMGIKLSHRVQFFWVAIDCPQAGQN